MNELLRRYQTIKTHFASDYGPCNLSGIQFDLKENIEQAESELREQAPELHELNRQLRRALDIVFDMGTRERNTHPTVVEVVGKMHDMAFSTEHLNRVANHPLPGLMISYMAGLAGYPNKDPLGLTRYTEMVEKLDARIKELEVDSLDERDRRFVDPAKSASERFDRLVQKCLRDGSIDPSEAEMLIQERNRLQARR